MVKFTKKFKSHGACAQTFVYLSNQIDNFINNIKNPPFRYLLHKHFNESNISNLKMAQKSDLFKWWRAILAEFA